MQLSGNDISYLLDIVRDMIKKELKVTVKLSKEESMGVSAEVIVSLNHEIFDSSTSDVVWEYYD